MTASPWLRKLLLTALSLWLTSIAVVVLLEHTGSVAAVSTRAADPATDPAQLTGDLPHALGGLLLVCVPLVRNIYKPRGLTAAASAIGTDTRQPHRDASGSARASTPPRDSERRLRMTTTAIQLTDVVKTYPLGEGEVIAVDHLNLRIDEGEFVAIVGRSGSGKTTLLNMLAGIDRPTTGSVQVAGADLGSLSESGLAAWRGTNIGLVFQFFQLLPTLTVAENVMLPMDFAKQIPVADRRGRAEDLLARVGIGEQADKLPSTLSGGQQQRAAIARALANDPPMLLTDEPTGNLDSHTADAVLELFGDLNAEGRTIVVVTHERDIRSIVKREVALSDGRIISDSAEKAGAAL